MTTPRPHRSLIALTILLTSAPCVLAQQDDVCGEDVIAWSEKVGKATRKRLRTEAELLAIQRLAERAWSTIVVREEYRREAHVRSDELGRSFSEDESIYTSARWYGLVSEEIRGGRFSYEGDRHFMRIRYCLSADQFERARQTLRTHRRDEVDDLRRQLADLEKAIRTDSISYASRRLPVLKNEVTAAVMDDETYTSPYENRTMTFRAWLQEWTPHVQTGRQYASYCAQAAARLVEQGHLAHAERRVREALAADRMHVPAIQLREQISHLRSERAAALADAERLASVGRFAAAEAKIARARAIDMDDLAPLEEAEGRVEGLRVEYHQHNPRARLAVLLVGGSLGVDPQGTIDHVANGDTGLFHASTATSYGAEFRFRIGRWLQAWTTGARGRSNAEHHAFRSNFLEIDAVSAGLGFRTVRSSDRPFSVQLGAGLARETAKLIDNDGETILDETREAPFVRLSLEGRRVMVYVQHAFGFEDEEIDVPASGAFAWKDSYQYGIMYSLLQ